VNKGHGAVVSTCMLGLHPTALLEVPLTKHVSCLDETSVLLPPLPPFRERHSEGTQWQSP
jgi:hypothetical protein